MHRVPQEKGKKSKYVNTTHTHTHTHMHIDRVVYSFCSVSHFQRVLEEFGLMVISLLTSEWVDTSIKFYVPWFLAL